MEYQTKSESRVAAMIKTLTAKHSSADARTSAANGLCGVEPDLLRPHLTRLVQAADKEHDVRFLPLLVKVIAVEGSEAAAASLAKIKRKKLPPVAREELNRRLALLRDLLPSRERGPADGTSYFVRRKAAFDEAVLGI